MAESTPSRFQWLDFEMTPHNGKRAFAITVPERDLDYNSALPERGDAWVDCPGWLKQVERVPTSLQDYMLARHQSSGGGSRTFFFVPDTLSPTTAYLTYYDLEPSWFWPKVLLSIMTFRRLGDDSYVLRPRYKEAYQGPTRVRIEEFFSIEPFTIPIYEPMIDRGLHEEIGMEIVLGNLWYSVGTLNLEPCLHPEINIAIAIDPVINYNNTDVPFVSLYDTATNHVDWPEEIVIDDRQREVLMGFVRRRVTAISPAGAISLVTLPTSASIGSTTATLGGTVTLATGTTVEDCGAVYAKTSENVNLEVDGTEESGGSEVDGVFTVDVTGLDPSSIYSFKPWVFTSADIRVYGPVGTFTTIAP